MKVQYTSKNRLKQSKNVRNALTL